MPSHQSAPDVVRTPTMRTQDEQTRILDMVERGELTAELGAKLLSASQAYKVSSEYFHPVLVTQLFSGSGKDKEQVRIILVEESTGKPQNEINISGGQLEELTMTLLSAIFQMKSGKYLRFVIDPTEQLVEIYIQEDRVEK